MKTARILHVSRLVSASMALLFAGSIGCGGELAEPALESTASALNVGQFHGWQQITGMTFKSGPAISSPESTTNIVCGLGNDNRIFCNSWISGIGWFGWGAIGANTFSTRPSITPFTDNNGIHSALVAVTAGGNAMINTTGAAHGGFQGWANLPAGQFIQPVAIVYQGSELQVFGVKADQRLYYTHNFVGAFYNQFNWTAWTEVPGGGLFSSAVAVTKLPSTGALALAGRGLDNRFWVTQGQTVSSVNGWHQLAGTAQVVAPAITSRGSLVDIFGAFANDMFSHVATVNASVASTPTFDTVPVGQLNTPTAATSRSSTTLDLVGRGNDNAFWIDRWF